MKLVVLAANMKEIGCVCSSLANTSEELRQSWTLKMELINTWAPRSTFYRPLKGNQGNYNQLCHLAHLAIELVLLSLEQYIIPFFWSRVSIINADFQPWPIDERSNLETTQKNAKYVIVSHHVMNRATRAAKIEIFWSDCSALAELA